MSALKNSAVRAPLILKKGSNVLLQRCMQREQFPLSEEALLTIDMCKDGLRNATGFWKGKGMSIAATQVGKPDVNLFLVCSRENWYTPRQYKTFQTIFNPRITAFSDNVCLGWEGCISNDDEMCLVERPVQVKAAFQDLKGKDYEMMLTGLMSRIFQHEIDHLNGLVMWDDALPDSLSKFAPEDAKITPRRLEKLQSLHQLASQEEQDKFYQANRRYIFEY